MWDWCFEYRINRFVVALQAQKDLNAIVERLDENIKNQTINQREIEGLFSQNSDRSKNVILIS